MKEKKANISKYPSKIKYSFLKILTGSDLSSRRLPFMSVESKNPGPVVWLTAGIHGDEVGGVVIIQEVFRKIKKSLQKGSVFAFPLMNPIGFETASRNITVSQEDLNRAFPGSPNGSLAERIAYKIFTSITGTNPALVLDLHTDWIRSIPYTLLDQDQSTNKTFYEKLKTFSMKTGFQVILDIDNIKKTLSDSLVQKGIPALTLELGESFVVNEKNIVYGVSSIFNILSFLEMVQPLKEMFLYPLPEIVKNKVLKYSDQPLSSTSGIIRFTIKPGDLVKKGETLARIYNTFGKIMESITATSDGLVLGYSDYSVAFPGSPLIAFGVL